MKGFIFISIILFCFTLFLKPSYGQINIDISLMDFSSTILHKLQIKEDWVNQQTFLILSFIDGIDTLEVKNVVEIDTFYVLQDRFLRIDFRGRGGSGVHVRFSKLFCVDKYQIYESLSLLTKQKSYATDGALKQYYWIDILLKFSKNKYSLIVYENEQGEDQSFINNRYNLLFDKKGMIFYSNKKKSSQINFCSLKPPATITFYLIALLKETYINYNGIWYQKGVRCYERM
jgi:hypothetical protein